MGFGTTRPLLTTIITVNQPDNEEKAKQEGEGDRETTWSLLKFA